MEILQEDVSDDEMVCYCHSITFQEAMKLLKEGNVKSFGDVSEKTIMCTNCGACELEIKEYFFPEELDLHDKGKQAVPSQ